MTSSVKTADDVTTIISNTVATRTKASVKSNLKLTAAVGDEREEC